MQDLRNDNSTAEERLIAAHDGDVALLYLFYRHTGSQDLEQAAVALCRTMQELRAAEEKLRRMGLWGGVEETPAPVKQRPQTPILPPADNELPSYTAQEITRLADGNEAFREICREAAKVKGKQLTSHELEMLAGIYEHLGLSPEVILLLLNYCLEMAQTRHPGSRPGWRLIQSEAFHWADLELLTYDQADAYIRTQRSRDSAVGKIQHLLHLDGRPLTAPERKNICLWLDQGFDEGAIQLAYERTVYNTGALKWAYMSKILQRWHSSGWHDRETIEEKDGRRAAPVTASSADEPVDMDELQRILDRI